MLKKILFSLIFVFVISTGNIYASEIAGEGTWQRKVQRGFLNIVLAPMEFTSELVPEKGQDRFEMKWISGLFVGSAKTVRRFAVGTLELVTAPLPGKSNYAPILLPEFPWEKLPASKN